MVLANFREFGRVSAKAPDDSIASPRRSSIATVLTHTVCWLLFGILPACTPFVWLETTDEPTHWGEGEQLLMLDSRPADEGDRLRGDHEAPETLFLAFEAAWPEVLAELVDAAAPEAEVVVLVNPDEPDLASVRKWIEQLGARSLILQYDTPWIRDYGPLELISDASTRRWIDADYGGQRPLDNGVPTGLAKLGGIPVASSSLALDGGGLINNGAGHCAMTQATFDTIESKAKTEAATLISSTLKCRMLTVVPALDSEPTGHIDLIAQFLTPTVVAVAELSPAWFPQESEALDRAVDLLRFGARALGKPLTIVRVPQVLQDETLFSYVNGVRLRRSFLVPSYASVTPELEELAYERLRAGLPDDIELLPVMADAAALRGGAIHCLTLGVGVRLHWSNPVFQESEGSSREERLASLEGPIEPSAHSLSRY